jgi:hypothetical protein
LNIVETLERTIQRLCTVGSGGPGPEWFDEELKAHIFDKVEVWCADAASNEFAAGRLARKGAFRNIMHVSKDNTHASVRPDGMQKLYTAHLGLDFALFLTWILNGEVATIFWKAISFSSEPLQGNQAPMVS